MSGTYGVRANARLNRLYIDFAGTLTPLEVQALAGAIAAEMKKLAPGFDVVNDISQCRLSDSAVEPLIKQIQQALAARGMRYVVRVVGESIKTMLAMWRLSNEVGYTAGTAVSVTEADAMLDDLHAGRSTWAPASHEPPERCPRCGYCREDGDRAESRSLA